MLYQYPPIIVPDELTGYITDEDINTARWLGNGFYARRVPCFSLYIEFDYADEIEREITAHYFLVLPDGTLSVMTRRARFIKISKKLLTNSKCCVIIYQ